MRAQPAATERSDASAIPAGAGGSSSSTTRSACQDSTVAPSPFPVRERTQCGCMRHSQYTAQRVVHVGESIAVALTCGEECPGGIVRCRASFEELVDIAHQV